MYIPLPIPKYDSIPYYLSLIHYILNSYHFNRTVENDYSWYFSLHCCIHIHSFFLSNAIVYFRFILRPITAHHFSFLLYIFSMPHVCSHFSNKHLLESKIRWWTGATKIFVIKIILFHYIALSIKIHCLLKGCQICTCCILCLLTRIFRFTFLLFT